MIKNIWVSCALLVCFLCVVDGVIFWSYRSLLNVIVSHERQRSLEMKHFVVEPDDSEECNDLEKNDDNFLWVVNRTGDYLREAAVAYAKNYNLDGMVLQLYEADEWTALNNKKQDNKKRINKKCTVKSYNKKLPGKKFTGSDLKRWARNQIDRRFILPIDQKKFWLSSPFGYRTMANGSRRFHYGVDMAAMKGTPVHAVEGGVVVQVGNQSGYGKFIVIKHDEKFKTRYAHLSSILTYEGKKVCVGEMIGRVGSTGNARSSGQTRDASHLHFEVEVYGQRMNPFYFFKVH